jgi:8-oxo-dGTP diphosphatase
MRPKVTCGAIIKKNNKILLTKRNISPYKNYWCLPGGHVEWREKVESAIKREVKEETGLDFKPKIFKYYDEIIPKRKWHAVVLFFIGEAIGTIKTDKNEVKEFKWFSEKETKKLNLAFINKQVLKDYFRSKK